MRNRRTEPRSGIGGSAPSGCVRGYSLVELVIALTLLAVGIMGFMSSYVSNVRSADEAIDMGQVRVAMDNVVEAMRTTPLSDIYLQYQGSILEAPDLERLSPSVPATAQVTCYVNERSLPAEFGGITDLDADRSTASADCSATYRLLPVRLLLTYGTRYGATTREVYVLLTNWE